jgi:hypothetical protein
MANWLYDKARNGFLKGDIAWKSGGDTFRAYLVNLQGGATYTPNQANDEFLDDIPAECLVALIALAPADPVAGVADAPDVTFLAVTGDECEALVLVKWVTNAADSPLIAYISTATGLPIIPNGGDIQVVWDAGANKIFKL